MSRKVADCFAYCERMGYEVVDPSPVFTWDDAMGMVLTRRADIIVVADHDEPPPERVPRWEAVTDPPGSQGRARRLP